MNLAEVIHASWVKRDNESMSLLDAAYTDARDIVQLEVECKAFRAGDSRGGTGPSLQDKAIQRSSNELRRARTLGQELIREDITDMERTASPSPSSAPFSSPSHKHNARVTSSCERTDRAVTDRQEARRFSNALKKQNMNEIQ